jgi:hypothetical protein
MHLELRDVNEQAWPDELLVELMVAQHVTHVLAEKALDALSEFLNTVGIYLRHAPGPIRRVRRPRRELPDLFLGAEI